jgi:hypothetical protein
MPGDPHSGSKVWKAPDREIGAIAFVSSSSLVQKGVVTWKSYDALIRLEE